MILENCSFTENDEKSKRETKNREMERDSSGEFTQQNLLFSPQVYKHLLSSPLFHSRSHMENKRSDIEMVRGSGGGGSSRQYFHGNDSGMMKRKYEEEVSGYLVVCVCHYYVCYYVL